MNGTDELADRDRVDLEAQARGYLRAKAFQPGVVDDVCGPQRKRFSDRVRELARQLEEEELRERRRDATRYGTIQPSALIAHMREDWPRQTAAVGKLAKRLDVPLGEAWALTIEAGVEAINRKRRP